MLYLLLFYIIISSVCFLAGALFYHFINRRRPETNNIKKPVVVHMITGLIILTGIGQWLVLFMPLNLSAFLITIITLLILGLFFRKQLQPAFQGITKHKRLPEKLLIWTGLGALLFMILVLNAGPTMMDDTESYHIQMVKWVQEYGSVPGIANLHLRYGFNSSWFISIGLLCPRLFAPDYYLLLNGLVSCWACIYCLEKLLAFLSRSSSKSSFRNQGLVVFLLLAFMLITWPMIRGNATTANYDFITTLCIVILFVETVFSDNFHYKAEWLIWPCYLFTVRIINFPLLLLAVIALWQLISQKKWKTVIGYSSIGALLILPFLIRNIILSGYPLFPATAFDFFPVDWKADKQMMVNIVDYIQYFNRVNAMHQSIEKTRSLTSPYWISAWYQFLSLPDKILVTVSLVCYSFCLLRWKYLLRQLNRPALHFLAVLVVLFVSWFLIAPDPRFVYGALLCGILLACLCIPAYKFFSGKSMVIPLIVTCSICFVYAAIKLYTHPSYQNYALPYRLPQPAVKTITIDHIELRIPEKILDNWNCRCYGTELPCLYNVHPALRARGPKISDGFYLDSTVKASFDPGAWY